MRYLLLCLLLLVPLAGAAAQGEPAERLIDPAFRVSDHSGATARLRDRFRALAERLRDMEAGRAAQGVDERLRELFLPDRPREFRSNYARELRIDFPVVDLSGLPLSPSLEMLEALAPDPGGDLR